MKKQQRSILVLLAVTMAIFLFLMGCGEVNRNNSDRVIQRRSEDILAEINRQVGMPAIKNFQTKKTLKWIYELCDQQDLICHAYLFNEMTGKVGQYLGQCVGYGIPYSTQFSNPEKVMRTDELVSTGARDWTPIVIPQAEPDGTFKPIGLSATWLIMIDPTTKELKPMYVEPLIIVSAYKLPHE